MAINRKASAQISESERKLAHLGKVGDYFGCEFGQDSNHNTHT